jgi:Transposase, Mutator family
MAITGGALTQCDCLATLRRYFPTRHASGVGWAFTCAQSSTGQHLLVSFTHSVHALIAVGVNGDGQREVLGLEVASEEDGAGWLGFLRGLSARGLSGVRLVISDAHRGLVDAIGAALPGAAWQRCRTH